MQLNLLKRRSLYFDNLLNQIQTKSLIRLKHLLEKKVERKTIQLQNEKNNLQLTKEILEEQNKDITDSINYAKQIQMALIPSYRSFLNEFPKSFIFFKSKDIVSGDFVWYTETESSYIIAAIDCTGHGVPGAFISLIASTLLNEIVNNKNIILPSQILNELDKEIKKALNHDSKTRSAKDGMDISICSINKLKTRMTYSAADRPMYYVRQGKLETIKLNSISIGSSIKNPDFSYHDIEIELFENDTFYLFSDGYTHQFNEADNKRFSSKRLKELFIKIANMNSSDQYSELDSTLKSWMGNRKQTDDITIIGLNI